MSTKGDSTFTLQKRRRRSSLFVDRPAESFINDSTETATTATCLSDANDVQLTNYITQLKSCKRSWIIHERELKSQLNSTTVLKLQCREYEDVQNHYLEYLDEEDRKFMEDMSPLVLHSPVQQKVDRIKEKIELLRSCYEEDKSLSSLLVENINQAVRYSVAVKFNEYSEKDEKNQLKLEKIEVSENAPNLLEYDSDV